MNIKSQLRCFFSSEALMSFRITDVVWVLFLLERGYSLAQVGIAEGIFHITSVICEVPSGMIADILGRKRTMILAAIAGGISSIFMGFGNHILLIFMGMLFSAIGVSMASGTEEAILYDSLVEAKQEHSYKKFRVYMSMLMRLCSMASCLFSPVAIFLGYQKVYILSALINLVQILFLLRMKEPIVTEKQQMRQENPFGQMKLRWKNHIQETFRFIKGHPKTMCKLLASAAIASPTYLTLMYLQEHLVACGWPESWIGIPMFVIPLGGVVGSWLASKGKVNLKRAALLCGVFGGLGAVFAGNAIILVAIVGAMVGRICEGFFEILVSEETNHEFESDQRATMISVDGMLYSVLMIVLSPITGFLGEQYNMQIMFAFLGGGLMIATLAGLLFYQKLKR